MLATTLRRFVFCLLAFAAVSAAGTPLLLRQPTVSATRIVFSYAGDLWSVPRAGGEAQRLTVSSGVESGPIFSPDGAMIAFTGEYDGNIDVFVMPAAGGVPKRLTFHPSQDYAVGWTPDGKRVLFASDRETANDGPALYTVSVNGGFPEKLPLPIGESGSYSEDGRHIAYVPLFQWQEAWKRYRGGQTRKIWLADLTDSSIVPVPRENSNDFNPMWVGDKVYFLSDRNGPVSLFSYDVKSRQVEQAVSNHALDLKSAAAGPGAIAYEQFGAIYLYDVKSGKSHKVDITVSGDLPEVRPHFVNVSKKLDNPTVSPNGQRAAFEARGEILTVPADKGDARNLTNTAGACERTPVWSPDGKTVAYISDESGEYMLYLRDQTGEGDVQKIALSPASAYYSELQWSPDSKKIAYYDNHLGLWYVDLADKKPVQVDKFYFHLAASPAWSPDSKWIAYPNQLRSQLAAIYLYSLADASTHQITDGLSDADSPVFDKEGKYLYFTASTNSGTSHEADISSVGRQFTASVYLVVLSEDLPSPFAPESDEEKVKKDEKKADDKKPDDKKAGKQPDVPPTKIDLDNIGQRILALSMPPRRYVKLHAGKPGVVFVTEEQLRLPGDFGPPEYTIHRFDLSKRRADVAISGVRFFTVADNGEKALYQQGDHWLINSIAPMGDAPDGPPPMPPASAKTLKTDALEVKVDPKAEWKQEYREAWRVEREFFYDPHLHGLDIQAAEARYQPYVDGLASRRDLNYIFTEMLGDITVGHMFVRGGDMPEVRHVQTGLLGADYTIDHNRYRFARVYTGENWNPEMKAPLTEPGVNVRQGEYLLAVNGQDLTADRELYELFEGTAGKSVTLRVGPNPSNDGSREVTVVPIPDEHGLRNLDWIEDNRRKVDRMTNGRVAYVYMPDTNVGGYRNFNRYFFAQIGKDAVIIDERFNHGGALATDVAEYLHRDLLSVVSTRDGHDFEQPVGIFGPKIMITNEFAGSGGDAMPWYFKRTNAGKIVGTRTWGGLVGFETNYPALMDGGRVAAPNAAVWNPAGKYDVENHGVSPDIEVIQDPKLVRQGHDPQLEKAVEVVMEELKTTKLPEPRRPDFPNYHTK